MIESGKKKYLVVAALYVAVSLIVGLLFPLDIFSKSNGEEITRQLFGSAFSIIILYGASFICKTDLGLTCSIACFFDAISIALVFIFAILLLSLSIGGFSYHAPTNGLEENGEKLIWLMARVGSEEVLYRGLIFTSVAALTSSRKAVFVQATLFALAHMPESFLNLIWHFISGYLLGKIRVLYESVLPGVFIHFIWNIFVTMSLNGLGYIKYGDFGLFIFSGSHSDGGAKFTLMCSLTIALAYGFMTQRKPCK